MSCMPCLLCIEFLKNETFRRTRLRAGAPYYPDMIPYGPTLNPTLKPNTNLSLVNLHT